MKLTPDVERRLTEEAWANRAFTIARLKCIPGVMHWTEHYCFSSLGQSEARLVLRWKGATMRVHLTVGCSDEEVCETVRAGVEVAMRPPDPSLRHYPEVDEPVKSLV